MAYDKQNILCRALILKERLKDDVKDCKKEVYVRYIDWSDQWNEWLPVDSDRIVHAEVKK